MFFKKKSKKNTNDDNSRLSEQSKNSSQSKNNDNNFSLQIFDSIDKNVENVKQALDSPPDLKIRMIMVGQSDKKCAIIYLDTLADLDNVKDMIIKRIQTISLDPLPSGERLLTYLIEHTISSNNILQSDSFDEVMSALLKGDTIVLVDGTNKVLVVDSKAFVGRQVEEPITESLVRGPRDGFTETYTINLALIRKRISDPNLRFKTFKVGRRSKKNLAVCFIAGIAHPDLIKEIERRLQSIDIDDVEESGVIEQWIEDSFLSPFPQITNTERPDRVAAGLLRGQVGIILDGTPFALVAPITVMSVLQSPEDYYERWIIGSLLRILRFFAAALTVFLPAFYIALVSYHPDMIPIKLSVSMAASREGVPFPAIIEAFLMEATMEMLREAGVRLPKPIGQTIGIVGGLVIGEAAVTAGIVSPIMVIVVAITAISSFALPYYGLAISFRVLRFGAMIAAGALGLYGIILFYIVINVHVANLKSFGIPYTGPIAPAMYRDWKDILLRLPITMLTFRPKYLQPKDKKRMNK